MSRVLLLLTALIILVAVAFTSAATSSSKSSPSRKAHIERIDLGNGKTLTRVRHYRQKPISKKSEKSTNNLAEPTMTEPPATTAAPFIQPTDMMFVISNYCNTSMTLINEPQVMNGGWVIPPPRQMNSFFKGRYTGFEVASNPGQQPFFNGTFNYHFDNPLPVDDLNVAFFAAPDEFGMEAVSATAWHLQIFSSEYKDLAQGAVAVYNIGLGDLHFTDKPIC